jgi:UDP-N-acetylmuramate--alanine ligase
MIQGSIRKIHFVGIGGTGMCGLAEILLNLGYDVCGSDLSAQTEAVDRLVRSGARVFEGHDGANVAGADLVVISSAIRSDNPEFTEATRLGIPILKRGQMLAEIMRLKYGVAVAGAHGKTTTTSLVGHVLSFAGLDPTLVVGGRLRSIGSNARMGRGDIFVAEADESDGSFLELMPTVSVVTNIDREHLDHYKNLDAIKAAFNRFITSVPFYGVAVLCGDDKHIRQMLPEINRPVVLYGFEQDCRVRAERPRHDGNISYFRLLLEDQDLGEFSVPLPGRHNIQNALAAIAISLFLGVAPEQIREALSCFEGVARRFEIRSTVGDVLHVDDYGHHPTEIRAVLRAAREAYGTRRLVVFFQPHRYSRTAALHGDFADAFSDADLVVLTDIYAAGEQPIRGVTGGVLRAPIERGSSVEVDYSPEEAEAIDTVANRLRPGDVLLTLGAGPIWRWGDDAMARFAEIHSPEETLLKK